VTRALARLAVGWAMLAAPPLPAGGAPPAARIDGLLSAARSAERLADAEARLADAEKLLAEEGGKLDSTERGFLHADILRIRGRVTVSAWRRDPAKPALRERARDSLLKAIEEYGALVKLCETRLEGIERRLRHTDLERNKDWRACQGYISRANYCEAWALYRLALVADGPVPRKGRLDQAIERFSSFTANGYRDHAIVTDCFLGQALCHFEMEQHFKVLELLKPARPDNTPADIFKRMTYLRIRAGQAYGSHLATENAARQYFDSLGERKKLDAIELGMCLERAKCLAVLADPNENPEYHKLFRGRLDEVARLVYTHGEPWRTELGHILGTHQGASPFQCLAKARSLLQAGQYAQAVAEAEKGVRIATTATDPAVLADLRYAKAAALAGLGEHVQAFRAMVDFLRRYPTDRRAEGLCTTAVATGRRALIGKPPLEAKEFFGFLDLLTSQFASCPEARKAAWHRGVVLLQTGQYAEARRLLEPVEPNSPVYALAQYGIAAAAVKQAEALEAAGPADPNALAELLDCSSAAVGRFLDAAGAEPKGPEAEAAPTVVDIAVATARRYLELPTPRPAAALAALASVDRLAALPDRAALKRRTLAVRAHLAAGDPEAAMKGIAPLLGPPGESGPAGADALAGVVDPLMAEVDRLAAAGKAEAARTLGEQVVRIQQLLLRDVTAGQATDRAAREPAVRFRLAETLRRLGRHSEAAGHYDWLLAHVPRGKAGAAIRGMALCREQAGRFAQASELWAELARGLEKSTEGWYEARYHWFRSLYRQGRREDARKLLAYFRLQHPKIAAADWQARFDELAREVGPPAGATTAGTK